MNKIIIVLFQSMLFSSFGIGQNQNMSYELFWNKIQKIQDTNYRLAKKIFQQNQKRERYDPVLVLHFMETALKNQDVRFYKKTSVKLMRNYGWDYNRKDTLEENLHLGYNAQILKNKLADWTIKRVKKNFTRWLKKNYFHKDFRTVLLQLHKSDQNTRRFIPQNRDSTCYFANKKEFDAKLKILDVENLQTIRELCLRNDSLLPNNFDNGIFCSNYVEFIIFHNLKQGNFDETMSIVFPFVEKTYLQGKISSYFFLTYDYFSSLHNGFQYFGTLGKEVETKNKEGLAERMKKYNLLETH